MQKKGSKRGPKNKGTDKTIPRTPSLRSNASFRSITLLLPLYDSPCSSLLPFSSPSPSALPSSSISCPLLPFPLFRSRSLARLFNFFSRFRCALFSRSPAASAAVRAARCRSTTRRFFPGFDFLFFLANSSCSAVMAGTRGIGIELAVVGAVVVESGIEELDKAAFVAWRRWRWRRDRGAGFRVMTRQDRCITGCKVDGN